jgi:hypothetical protein
VNTNSCHNVSNVNTNSSHNVSNVNTNSSHNVSLELRLVHPVAVVFLWKSQINHLCQQLIVSLLYTNHTTYFGYTAILSCVMYIKMLILLLKHNGSINLVSNVTIIQVLHAKTIYMYKNYSLKTVKPNKMSKNVL